MKSRHIWSGCWPWISGWEAHSCFLPNELCRTESLFSISDVWERFYILLVCVCVPPSSPPTPVSTVASSIRHLAAVRTSFCVFVFQLSVFLGMLACNDSRMRGSSEVGQKVLALQTVLECSKGLIGLSIVIAVDCGECVHSQFRREAGVLQSFGIFWK